MTGVASNFAATHKTKYPIEHELRFVRNIAETLLEERFPTLYLVGRNGMHKYNNQDHAMMTAMLCVENILAEKRLYDLWRVNQDAEYHESGTAGARVATSGLRSVPTRLSPQASEVSLS